MTMRMLPLAAAMVLAGGCATTSAMREARVDPEVEKALAGRIAGKPQQCLRLSDAQESHSYDGAILYRVSRNLTFRNDMNGCPVLGDDRIPVVRVFNSEICRGDIVNFADRVTGAEYGGCTFGDFVPYRKPDATPR